MHFKDEIKKILDKGDIDLFVDMDGVIASYDVGKPLKFDEKRPLLNNINILKDISLLDGIELHILSICRMDTQIDEKNNWLDIHASFFKKENRNILSKETIKNLSSSEIKSWFLNNYKSNKQVVVLDDDNLVLKTIMKNNKNIILFQDSELVD